MLATEVRQSSYAWLLMPVLCILTLTACVSNVHTPYLNEEVAPVLVDSAVGNASSTPFDYPKQEVVFTNHDLPYSGRDYLLKQIKIPAERDTGPTSNEISFRYLRHVGPEPKPLVIIVPIYGSYTYPSEKITAGLQKLDLPVNIAVLEYSGRLFDFEGLAAAQSDADAITVLSGMRADTRAAVVDVRRIVDWAEQQSEIDADKVAAVSFSMSALIGSLLAQHEPRLRASVVVMGAAQFDEILMTCEGRAGMAREAVMQNLGWSDVQYKEHVRNELGVVDPVRYPGMADPSQILIIDALYDNCMPPQSRDALWEVLGRPERISYRYTHKRSFLAMTPLGFNVMRRRIYDFIQAHLG